MSIEKDENIDGHALLLLSALHPSMNIDASSMLVCGKRDDILSFMNKENFTKTPWYYAGWNPIKPTS